MTDFEQFFNPKGPEIESGRLSTEADFDKFFHDSNTNTGATASGVRDVTSAVMGVDYNVGLSGFNTVNAIKGLEQTMISLTPQPLSFGKQLLLSFVGAIGGAGGGSLSAPSKRATWPTPLQLPSSRLRF